jgi:hypothetical protein
MIELKLTPDCIARSGKYYFYSLLMPWVALAEALE